ncbi:putative flippase GtrA [Saonia flava]|uniref:Putative flippase GtrA n=1 Tax=Saonia flava TaxID=523696 RepID=A0A846R1G2_9FLAO|nr:DUF4199 domain-containing protein [Saonia flava]NJB71785.1 putative flippase GtrA [Saonia flava]
MKNTVLRYGLYGAITICVLFLSSWFLGKGLDYAIQEIIGYAVIIVSLSFVFFGIKHFRDKENNGKLSLKKGLAVGILISLITALAFGLLDVIYVKIIDPNFTEDYYTHSIEQMKANLSPEDFKVKLADLEEEKELFSNPLVSFFLMFITVFVIGFIISLLSSLMLQRKQ